MANKQPKKKTTTRKHLARKQREARQTRIIVIVTIVIGVLIIGLVGYGLVDQLLVRPRIPVAQVGETVIRVREFEAQVQYTRIQMLNQTYQYYNFSQQFGEFGQSFLQTAQSLASQLSQPVALGSDVLDEMINSILIREAAAERGITASEQEIDEALQAAFGFFPDGTPTPTQTATIASTPTLSETSLALVTLTPTSTATDLPTETPEVSPTPSEAAEEIDEAEGAEEDAEAPPADESQETRTVEASPTITLTPTPFTTEVFAQNLKEFDELYDPYNFTIQDLREMFEVQILREKLQEEVTAELVPVKDEVWARHILVETAEEAQEVLEALEAGDSFEDLAAEYSIDDSNSQQGGDLGWFDTEMMVPEFTETAFSLEEGEISAPVETDFGFHIVQVLAKRESQIPPDEFLGLKQETFTNWLSEQRSARQDITIYDEWEDYVPTTPEIPQQFLIQLYQQQEDTVPPLTP